MDSTESTKPFPPDQAEPSTPATVAPPSSTPNIQEAGDGKKDCPPDTTVSPTSANSAQPSSTPQTQQVDESKKGFHLWVDTVSKIAVIVAAIVGGLWGLKLYRETTGLTLEHKTAITSTLNWIDKLETDTTCWAEYHVTLKNDGQIPFDIDRHTVTAWVIDRSAIPLPTKAPTSFGPAFLTNERKVYQYTVDTSADKAERPMTDSLTSDLHGHYPAGSESSSSANLVFGKQKGADAIVVMQIELHGHQTALGGNDPVDDHSWTIDKLCPKPEQPAK